MENDVAAYVATLWESGREVVKVYESLSEAKSYIMKGMIGLSFVTSLLGLARPGVVVYKFVNRLSNSASNMLTGSNMGDKTENIINGLVVFLGQFGVFNIWDWAKNSALCLEDNSCDFEGPSGLVLFLVQQLKENVCGSESEREQTWDEDGKLIQEISYCNLFFDTTPFLTVGLLVLALYLFVTFFGGDADGGDGGSGDNSGGGGDDKVFKSEKNDEKNPGNNPGSGDNAATPSTQNGDKNPKNDKKDEKNPDIPKPNGPMDKNGNPPSSNPSNPQLDPVPNPSDQTPTPSGRGSADPPAPNPGTSSNCGGGDAPDPSTQIINAHCPNCTITFPLPHPDPTPVICSCCSGNTPECPKLHEIPVLNPTQDDHGHVDRLHNSGNNSTGTTSLSITKPNNTDMGPLIRETIRNAMSNLRLQNSVPNQTDINYGDTGSDDNSDDDEDIDEELVSAEVTRHINEVLKAIAEGVCPQCQDRIANAVACLDGQANGDNNDKNLHLPNLPSDPSDPNPKVCKDCGQAHD